MSDVDSLNLNLLTTLRVFVEEGSVQRAATRLGRSQPAITARLRQLEDELGAPLFERVGRRLGLTPLGRRIDEEARQLVRTAQRVHDLARTDALAGNLRIGVLPTMGTFVVAPALGRLMAHAPELHPQLRFGLGSDQLRALRSGGLDAVVSVGAPPDHPDLNVTELFTVHAVMTRSTLRASKAVLAFGRMGDPFFDAVQDRLDASTLAPRITMLVPHIQTLKALIRAGAGIAVLPDYTIIEPDLQGAPIAEVAVSQTAWMATRGSSRTQAATNAVRSALLSETSARRLHQPPPWNPKLRDD